MALSFPSSPSNNDTFYANGIYYIYDSVKNVWKVVDLNSSFSAGDASTLDGQAASYYLDYTNINNKPDTATNTRVDNLRTSNIAESSSALYFTNARSRAAISVTGPGTYDSSTGVIVLDTGVTTVNGQDGVVVLSTSDLVNDSGFVNSTYVQDKISDVVGAAPSVLDTLSELATALGDDSNFSTTVTTLIGTKAGNTYVQDNFAGNAYVRNNFASNTYVQSNYLSNTGTLPAISALTPTDNNFIVGNGVTWIAETGSTAAARLGLGNMSTQASSNVSITGGNITGMSNITASLATITTANITNGRANVVVFNGEYNNGNSSTSLNINFNNGQKQKVTITGNCTFTFTAPTGPGNFLLKMVNGGNNFTGHTWPATVKWGGAAVPAFTPTSGNTDIVTFYYDGTNYYGVASLNFV